MPHRETTTTTTRPVDWRLLYRRAFENLGHRLTNREGVSDRAIKSAENRLGVAVPRSLADYFALAGRETRFNCCFNRLLPTEEWFVAGHRLVFMEENQAVVYWGVPAECQRLDDPPVWQGVNGETIKWYRESDNCSVFLTVMLQWHGAFGGGLPEASTAFAPLSMRKALCADWKFVGEVNRMQAFTKPGKAICHLKWNDGWRVFAGATTKKKMEEIADEFSLVWLA